MKPCTSCFLVTIVNADGSRLFFVLLVNVHVHLLVEQRAFYIFKYETQHFRGVILMSLNKDLYS